VNEDSKRLTVTGSIDPHIFKNNTTRYKKRDYTKPYITYNSAIISEGKWALFSKPKVMVAGMTKTIEAALDVRGAYAPAVSVYSICGKLNQLYQVQLIINSKLINWFFRYKFSDKHMAGGYISVNNLLLQKIPFKIMSEDINTKELVESANSLRTQLETLGSNFTLLLKSKFQLEKLPKKLNFWYKLTFEMFLKELEKVRKKSGKASKTQYNEFSLSEEAEWLQYFKEQKERAQTLQAEINQIDREIDNMVYELYGLTEAEIKIVESA
jgi:hypothetical protein